jgi:tripartite-type tricarboxylate transporter receptor subunit TctC
MKLSRRRLLQALATSAAAGSVPSVAVAQPYPGKPVRIVVGFAPGGVSDLYARLVARSLSEKFGQQFVVDNRTGAGGSIATDAVIRSTPDGYTLLMTGANDAFNTALYDTLSFNFVRDVAPISGVARFPGVVVVRPSFPAKTLAGLFAYVRENPSKVTMASGGIGAASHVFWELLKNMTKLSILHVPYRGEGPALLDLLGGQVDVMIPTIPPAIEYIRAHSLVPLAVTTGTPSPALPDVPTVAQLVPSYDAFGWVGLAAPKNTPREIVDRLNAAVVETLTNPKMAARIVDQGGTPFLGSSAEFGSFLGTFTDKWAGVIRAANIKAE